MFLKNNTVQEGIVFVVISVVVFGPAFFFIPQPQKSALEKNRLNNGTYQAASDAVLPQGEQKSLRNDIEIIAKRIAAGNKQGEETFAPQYVHMAGAYEALGMTSQAKNAYARALLEDAKNSDAFFGMAHIALQEGDMKKTEDLYRQVIAFYEKDPRGYAALADFYANTLKDEERARTTYLRGLLATNNTVSLARAYALFLEESERNYEAYLYWSGIVKEDPQNQEARAHMDALRPSVQDAIRASERAGKTSPRLQKK